MGVAAKEQILLVDDEPQILVALEDLLGDQFIVLKAPSGEAAMRVMEQTEDIAVVVTDQRMPDMAGDELATRLNDHYLAQKILVTGYADLGAVVRAVNEGRIFAYVTKPWDELDLRAKVAKAAEQFRLGQELANEKRLLRDLMDNIPDGIYFKDRDLRFIRANKSIASWLDTDLDALVGKRLRDVASSQEESAIIEMDELASLKDGRPILDAIRQVQNGDTVRWLSERKAPILGPDGAALGLVGICRDITEQRQLEQQLLQSQKMDAIGRLAGGVAHDFNNLLAVILSYGELLQDDFPPGDSRHESLEELLNAGHRAAALTKQLLTFSRQRRVHTKVMNINEVIEGVVGMLKRLIHENIQLTVNLAPDVLPVLADVTHVEQVILNLAINARDAMADGGQLSISTKLSGADRVCLRVVDTGTGMTPEVQARVFEPFFSTKEEGKGTGLGLATVYGIVRQLGGEITIESEPGRGTAFQILLPISRTEDEASSFKKRSRPPSRGTGTILLVEDDDAVRRVAKRIIEESGYQVLEAAFPSVAQTICDQPTPRIDLLLVDVVMPEMDGPALARDLLEKRPDLRVLFMSGYAKQSANDLESKGLGANFIEKPFSPAALIRAIQSALHEGQVQDAG